MNIIGIKPIARGREEYLRWVDEQPGHVTEFVENGDEACIKCGLGAGQWSDWRCSGKTVRLR